MKFSKLLTGLGLATAMSAAQALPINHLQNNGFETGDFSGWNVGGVNGGSSVQTDGSVINGISYNPFLPAYQNVRSGNFAANGVTAQSHDEYVSLSQTMNLSAGDYSAGFYMGSDQGSSFGISSGINKGDLGIYVNNVLQSFNSTYNNNFQVGSSAADFTLFDTDFTWAGGALTIEYRFTGSGTARAGISVDDFFLNGESESVSEPASLALLGLGLAGLGFARRKQNA